MGIATTNRKEMVMAKHEAPSKQEKALAKRVASLEREMKAIQQTVPMPPEQRANYRAAMEGETPSHYRENPKGRDHAGPVNERIAALKGHSRSDLVGDAERKGGSPLGYGGKRRG